MLQQSLASQFICLFFLHRGMNPNALIVIETGERLPITRVVSQGYGSGILSTQLLERSSMIWNTLYDVLCVFYFYY